MGLLTCRDLSSAIEFLHETYALCDLEEFRSVVVTHLPKLVRSDVTAYNEIDTRQQSLRAHINPVDAFGFPGAVHLFEQHMHEHPLIGHHLRVDDPRVLKISDFLSQSQYRDLGLYQEFFRRVGTEYQMVCTLPARSPVLIGIALNRSGKDFTERERLLMELLRPHLMQAYNNAAALKKVLEELEAAQHRLNRVEGVMIVGRDGRSPWISPGIHRLLRKYFGMKTVNNGLPDVLKPWVRHQSGILSRLEVPRSLMMRKDGARLTIRMLPGREQMVLLFQEERVGEKPVHPATVGLTSRESEVLGWVAQGKSNSEIATILAMSVRTVEKHLEHIFDKLGVESRTAAAARFWESGRPSA
jgi:DNA-binding CsgD family transcriptional regulator